jgi:hypothetical protein
MVRNGFEQLRLSSPPLNSSPFSTVMAKTPSEDLHSFLLRQESAALVDGVSVPSYRDLRISVAAGCRT